MQPGDLGETEEQTLSSISCDTASVQHVVWAEREDKVIMHLCVAGPPYSSENIKELQELIATHSSQILGSCSAVFRYGPYYYLRGGVVGAPHRLVSCLPRSNIFRWEGFC